VVVREYVETLACFLPVRLGAGPCSVCGFPRPRE
jgi:hypothetical protein